VALSNLGLIVSGFSGELVPSGIGKIGFRPDTVGYLEYIMAGTVLTEVPGDVRRRVLGAGRGVFD